MSFWSYLQDRMRGRRRGLGAQQVLYLEGKSVQNAAALKGLDLALAVYASEAVDLAYGVDEAFVGNKSSVPFGADT